MSDDPIERLRAHVEKHKHRQNTWVSTVGLAMLLDKLNDARGLFVTVEQENIALTHQRDALKAQVEDLNVRWLQCCSNLVAIAHQRDELKAQVERLIAKEGARIGKALLPDNSEGRG